MNFYTTYNIVNNWQIILLNNVHKINYAYSYLKHKNWKTEEKNYYISKFVHKLKII